MSREELLQSLQSLNSNKKKDRSISVDKIKNLLSHDRIRNLLNPGSDHETLSWDVLYLRLHNSVLMEFGKSVTKSSNGLDKHIQNMLSVIISISEKAVDEEIPFLSCNVVVSSVLSVFESDLRAKYLGSTYIEVLSKYILRHRKFWGEIKMDHWIGMKRLCMSCFKNPPQNTPCVIYLDILCDIIRISCKNVLMSHNLLDIFYFIKTVCSSLKGTFCAFEVSLLKLINTLCLQLAIEFRYKVCSFMEDIFDFVLSLYNRKENSTNPSIYHFLITYLNVHSPNGVNKSDQLFYACDEKRWEQQVIAIYSLTQEAIQVILKNPVEIKLELGFMDLVVELHHLMFNNGFDRLEILNSDNSGEGYSETPACLNKRKRSMDSSETPPLCSKTCRPRNKLIKLDNNLIHIPQDPSSADSWFWLKFLERLLQKFPLILKTEWKRFTQSLAKLLLESRESKLTHYVCKCLCNILSKENCYGSQMTETEIRECNDIWNNVGVELIRLFKIEDVSEYHMLMRSLVTNSKLRNSNSLIDLYCKEVFKRGRESFSTLLAICQSTILPESVDCLDKNDLDHRGKLRPFFLKWLFAERTVCPAKELSKILISLILTRSEEDEVISFSNNSENVIMSKGIDDFCKLITSNYETISLRNVKFKEHKNWCEAGDSNVRHVSVSHKADGSALSELLSSLCIHFTKLHSELLAPEMSETEELNVVKDCLYHCELLLNLYSYFKSLNLDIKDWNEQMDSLKVLLSLTTRKSVFWILKDNFSLLPFVNIYNSSYSMDLSTIIRCKDYTQLSFVQNLFEIFQQQRRILSRNNYKTKKEKPKLDSEIVETLNPGFSNLIRNPRSILHINNLLKEERRIVEIVEVLCHYIIIRGSSEPNHFQKTLELKLFDELLISNSLSDYNCYFDLQLIFVVLYNFSKYDGIRSATLNKNLKLLLSIFESRKSDSEVFLIILLLMKDFFRLTHRHGDEESRTALATLLNGLRNVILVKKQCGVNAVLKYVEFLAAAARVEVEETEDETWRKEGVNIHEEIMSFLSHPCCEVRLYTARIVGVAFAPSNRSKEEVFEHQKNMISRVASSLDDWKPSGILGGDANVIALVKSYWKDVEMSVSMLTWASIICSSGYWRKSALFHLFRACYIKKLPANSFLCSIQLICNELEISDEQNFISIHLRYLLQKWAEENYPPEEFPHRALRCSTTYEFFETYLHVLLPIYLWNGCDEASARIFTKLKKSLKEAFEDCYPELMAIVLPCLGGKVGGKAARRAEKIKSVVDRELGPDFSNLMLRHLDKFLFNVFSNIEDKMFLRELTHTNPCEDAVAVSFTVSQIGDTLECLSRKDGESLLGEASLERPDAVQKVLILLAAEVERAHLPEDKIIALHKYAAFVDLLSKATAGSACRDIVPFVVRDVVHTLVAFIRLCESKAITVACLNCLKNLLRCYIPEFGQILNDFLSDIIIMCKPLVRDDCEEALDILKFLICENRDKLNSATIALDSFPTDDPRFEGINAVLEKSKRPRLGLRIVLQHFLEGPNKKRYDIETLKYLRDNLTQRKEELKKMYEDLAVTRGFSEDCSKSLLHRLICDLIELTSDKNPVIRAEAGKCLGELGPSDLSMLVLKPENEYTGDKRNESPLVRLLKTCIDHLSVSLIADKIETKAAASDLLYIILSTRTGRDIVKYGNPKLRMYLTPFVSCAGERTLRLECDPSKLSKHVGEGHAWIPVDHPDWIATLVAGILKSFDDSCGLVRAMIKTVEIDWHFAERIFPILLDLILSFGSPGPVELILDKVGGFFREYYEGESQSRMNRTSLRCMVNVVDYIRIQRSRDKFDLNINYLHVAEAARCCSALFTSILYIELWFEGKRKSEEDLTLDRICELYPTEGLSAANILSDCYSKIGISDGIRGCGYMHLLAADTEIQHYDRLKMRNLSMLHYDIKMSQGVVQAERHLMNSLQQASLLYSVNQLVRSSDNRVDLSEIEYRCASNLADWSLLDSRLDGKNALDTYERSRYFALKAFHNNDQISFRSEVLKARKCTASKLASCSLESVHELYPLLSELRCVKELEDFAFAAESPSPADELTVLYRRWREQDRIKCSDFKSTENILTQRITMIKEGLSRAGNDELKSLLESALCETYYRLVKTARMEKEFETAIRYLSHLGGLKNISDHVAGKMKIEKSLVTWEIGEVDAGKFLLRHYLKTGEIEGKLRAKALRIYGDWMASTNSENCQSIIEQYYLESVEKSRGGGDRVKAFASLAKFADSNYKQVKERLSSPLFETKRSIINRQQDMAHELRQEIEWNKDREKKIAYDRIQKQSAMDENEIKSSETEKELYLNVAVEHYLLSLIEGDKYDILVFRLISLWFANSDNENVTARVRKHLGRIPAYKFLCLLPQIMPRMADIGLVSTLIEQCAKDHPHHTLPLLFALANSFEDSKYNGAHSTPSSPSSTRALMARAMLEKLQKDPKLRPAIREMDRFCDAMIELANTSPGDVKTVKAGTRVKIPANLKLLRLGRLDSVAVPSATIPPRKSCNYDDVVGIMGFEESYELVGGVNMPKKIKCLGLDGVSRPLLVKGRDDLRQDAVMQQVFTIMNSLLQQNSETSRRKLTIRTYKVVPLSQRSGIIEWCENTQTLNEYLVGRDPKSGAHGRYNPNDLTALECRALLQQVSSKKETNDVRLKVFTDICSKFRPAFRHFFFENFLESGVWFERRLAYTRSVATSSMIGYVLGIGDRHGNNILIDNSTAEVIHIDLGIAFELGKTLPHPETVPFRLTRDIVDGMGLSGVEGVFRLSCVKTMEVLRENQNTILTLLEVLLYDPLYAWTITTEKALSVQGSAETGSSEKNSSDVEVNKMAERALIRLKQKLQGIETGGGAMNAEGQVNYLIQQARDFKNLSRLFHGWQAYL